MVVHVPSCPEGRLGASGQVLEYLLHQDGTVQLQQLRPFRLVTQLVQPSGVGKLMQVEEPLDNQVLVILCKGVVAGRCYAIK